MHRIPPERAQLRMIDAERVCKAMDAIDDEAGVQAWTQRFSLLGDLTRARLLMCIKAAGPISVSDLTAATGLHGDTVSQTLRFLRANKTVMTERDGRVIRYQIADPVITELLDRIGQAVAAPRAVVGDHTTNANRRRAEARQTASGH